MELTLQINDQTKAAWLIQLLNELDFVEISDKSVKIPKMDAVDRQFSDQLDSLIEQYRPALEALAK